MLSITSENPRGPRHGCSPAPALRADSNSSAAREDMEGHFVKDAVPSPMEIPLEHAVNAMPTLLEQMPLPRSTADIHLSDLTTVAGQWKREKLDRVSKVFSACVEHLSSAGQGTGLLHSCWTTQQLHSGEKEAGDTDARCVSLERAAEYITKRSKGSLCQHLENAPKVSVSPSIAGSQKTNTKLRASWERQVTDRGMTLRPRTTVSSSPIRASSISRPASVSSPADESSVIPPPIKSTTAVTRPQTKEKETKQSLQRIPGNPSKGTKVPNSSAALESSSACQENSSFSQLLPMDFHGVGAHTLWRTALQVSLVRLPFAAVETEKMMETLEELLEASKARCTTDCNSAAERDYLQICSAVLVLSCLSHPSFPATAAAIRPAIIDHMVSYFSLLSRVLSQNVSYLNVAIPESDSSQIPGSFPQPHSQHKFVIHLFELLRFSVLGLHRLICVSVVRLVSDSNLVRLEDVCYRLLFMLPHAMGKKIFKIYASYALQASVTLYRTIWNHLNFERHVLQEEFFCRLIAEDDCLLERLFDVEEGDGNVGSKVMPITIAILSAIQSHPMPESALKLENEEPRISSRSGWIYEQCSLWVESLSKFLLQPGRCGSKEEHEARLRLVGSILEDTASLVGFSEWPSADLFTRMSIFMLSRTFHSHFGVNSVSNSNLGNDVDALRSSTLLPFAVDTVARLLQIFLSPPYTSLCNSSTFSMSPLYLKSASAQVLTEVFGKPQYSDSRIVLTEPNSDCGHENAQEWSSSDIQQLQEALWNQILSRYQCAGSESRSSALQCGLAHLSFWYWLEESSSSNSEVKEERKKWLDKLSHATEPNGLTTGTEAKVSDRQMRTLSILVSAQSDHGVLHDSTRRMMISLLLSSLQPHGAEESVNAAVLVGIKKSLGHLSELVQQFPQLVEVVWPIIRKHISHSSSRVRESSVLLLHTLLCTSLKHAVGASSTQFEIAINVLSSLLHLLDDDSVVVVSRVLSAFEGLLTDLELSSALRRYGENHIVFIENKLLSLVSQGYERRHVIEVTKIFLRRWVQTLAAEETASVSFTQTTLVSEVTALVELHSGPFPYEITEAHPVLQLLKQMWSLTAGETSSTAPSKRATAAENLKALKNTLSLLSRSLWSRFQSPVSKTEAATCLCSLYILSVVCCEVIEPLTDMFLRYLAYPPAIMPLMSEDGERVGSTYLHVSLIMRQILCSPTKPTLSLDSIATALTQLLSRYSGLFQQRVILASCGALVSMIKGGAAGDNAFHSSVGCSEVYLKHCYNLMNSYYVRLKGLLPSLSSNSAHLGYAQRFLFLLSEFLRQYRGWNGPLPGCVSANLGKSDIPNLLASGGVCENIYSLIVDLEKCVALCEHPKLNVIVLRTISSLCMLDPNTYLYRFESQLASAVDQKSATEIQISGLSFIRDFLLEEDSRVEKASRFSMPEREGLPRKTMKDEKQPSPGDFKSSRKRKRNIPKVAVNARNLVDESATEAEASTALSAEGIINVSSMWMEDQNSGMSTWLMSRFISSVGTLVSSPVLVIRQLCFQVLELTARGGLLPPSRYVDGILLLTGDVSGTLRRSAINCWREYAAGLREDAILTVAIAAAHLSFNFQYSSRNFSLSGHLHQTAFCRMENGTMESVWNPYFTALHKRTLQRTFLRSVLRCFYATDKIQGWLDCYPPSTWSVTNLAATALLNRHPLTYLAFLALAVCLLPIQEPEYVAKECEIGIDLEAQSALDSIYASKVSMSETSTERCFHVEPSLLYKAVGVVYLSFISKFMNSKYDASLKQRKLSSRGPRHKGSETLSESMRVSTMDFESKITRCAEDLSPLLESRHHSEDSNSEAFKRADEAKCVLLRELELVVSSVHYETLCAKRSSRRPAIAQHKRKGVAQRQGRKTLKRSLSSTSLSTETSQCSSNSSFLSCSDVMSKTEEHHNLISLPNSH